MVTQSLGQKVELQALFQIAEILERKDLSLPQMFRGVVTELPHGFQHPEICRARIEYQGEIFESQGFERTPWVLRSRIAVNGQPAGVLEVVYLQNFAGTGSSPFLFDQKKLVELTAQKLGQSITNRGKSAPHAAGRVEHPPMLPHERKPEWQAIMDLLAEIDSTLHRRLLRRLMNHLTKLGVPGIQEMIVRFAPAIYTAQREIESHGSNVPLPKKDISKMGQTFRDISGIASITLSEEELNGLFREWMRQDKLGFLALAAEKRDISLVEISDIVDRFCQDTSEDESALAPTDDMNVRVALIRRFLSDSLKFIRVTKEYMTIYDFGRLLDRVAGPAQGSGKLGGKAAGLIRAAHILRKVGSGNPLLQNIRTPKAWYITSDGIYNFLRHNSMEDLWSLKFSNIDEIRQTYPYLEQVFKNSFFSMEMYQRLQHALDDLGEGPLIVRSSSLLEDSEGSAFSGKYRSLFLANIGTREKRLEALLDAVAEVYASVFAPDPIQYRAERGLLDFMEEMGIIIQRVIGTRAGKYFFPAFAGVGFSNNEFRWSPRLRREDGILRIVTGLGTRAVDRIGDDFPVLVSPGQPELRVNVTPDQVLHYAQTSMDVLNLQTGCFESPTIQEVLKEAGTDYPMLDQIMSIYHYGTLKKPMRGMLDPERDDLVVTFAGLLENTPFIKQMHEVLKALQKALGMPVDLEFAHDGKDLYLLQCRPQSKVGEEGPVSLPTKIPFEQKIFSANKYVTNGFVSGIRYVVYVDPEHYSLLPSHSDMMSVADAVSRLNNVLPRRSFILMGPGRWGSRGDIALGVGVTYTGINNSQMLIEIARKKGNYVPDLSFGTHFFQDLVEARIRYLALYPDEEGNLFNADFLQMSPNALARLAPEFANLQHVIRVIDIEEVLPGHEFNAVMDGDQDRALGYLIDHSSHRAEMPQ